VALAAGAWGASLLPQLGLTVPLTANKQQVVYLEGLGDGYGPGTFPVFLNLDHDFYGFPLDAEGLLKASVHAPGPVIDPNAALPPDPPVTHEILSLIGLYIPGAAHGRVANVRTCMYAMTPDEDFIIDRLPGTGNAVIAAGFSGHGFKFGPLIGQMVAALLLGEEPEFWTPQFSLARFGPGAEYPDPPTPRVRRGT
jgi:glycine/D-amino acid oxidase-like deaminating enzyme